MLVVEPDAVIFEKADPGFFKVTFTTEIENVSAIITAEMVNELWKQMDKFSNPAVRRKP
jgi:hypothetical protein